MLEVAAGAQRAQVFNGNQRVANMILSNPRLPASRERGFTIIELMIALSVLSVLLIMTTVILISISSIYTKGVNASTLQNATRNIEDDVVSTLRFNAYAPSAEATANETINGQTVAVNAICIGATRYSFILNEELGLDNAAGTNLPHILWRDTRTDPTAPCAPINDFGDSGVPNGDASSQSDPTTHDSTGYEMAAQHTRVTNFSVNECPVGSGTYYVSIWTAYGDSDLLSLQSGQSSCANSGAGPEAYPLQPTCKNTQGNQFCAISALNTSVIRRLASD